MADDWVAQPNGDEFRGLSGVFRPESEITLAGVKPDATGVTLGVGGFDVRTP